ncbi:Cloroperoxidase [Pleomassaria siparia CBS 279.74]|uniref:Cloroperoxidase n=1 Tax=Pleomassaria siparia CBS 279.74 TaxID=1314801 RepID=A0A6G1KDM9_9PLEO|nr:Cloroperoxidase [Pleomassaria siparia CBS 279.74]
MYAFKTFCLVAATSVFPSVISALDEVAHPWISPSDADARSPCPGLNALANHGILPRDGKAIDLDILVAAVSTGFNLSSAATLVVGNVALKASTTGNASTFDLDDLDVHDPQVIEHDGSMTRNDSYWGDAHTFNNQTWARTLQSNIYSKMSDCPLRSAGSHPLPRSA